MKREHTNTESTTKQNITLRLGIEMEGGGAFLDAIDVKGQWFTSVRFDPPSFSWDEEEAPTLLTRLLPRPVDFFDSVLDGLVDTASDIRTRINRALGRGESDTSTSTSTSLEDE